MSDYHLGAQQTDAGVPGGTPTGSSTPPAPGAGATLTQEQVNAIVAEERRKWKAAQDAAAAAARRKADEAAAQAAGEWQTVAQAAQAERDRLAAARTADAARLTALTESMEKQINARVRALPEALRDLIPADADVLTRYDLIGKAEAAAQTLAGDAPPRGTHAGPSRSQAAAASADEAILADKRARFGG